MSRLMLAPRWRKFHPSSGGGGGGGGTTPDLAFHDFNDLTIGPYYVDSQPPVPGTEVDFVNDPTGSGRGGVARLHYHHYTSPDRNISLEFNHAIAPPTPTVYFGGDVYIAASTLSDFGRKLLYWQNYTNYTKYGTNSDGGANFSSVVGLQGSDLFIDNFHTDHLGNGTHDQHAIYSNFLVNTWYRLEMKITQETTPGAANGVCQIWLNGTQIYLSTTTNWTDAAQVGLPLLNGNGTPFEAADAHFQSLLVGEQVNDNSNSSYDEYRYWDNVGFATFRIP
jgi:hypothetical protein